MHSSSVFSSQPQAGKVSFQRLPLEKKAHISRDWEVPATDIDRARDCLVLWFERGGLHDAAVHWLRHEGRLTASDAARHMKESGECEEAFVAKFVNAARSGEIPAYAPGQLGRRVYSSEDANREIIEFVDEFYIHDLNNWIEKNEPHIKFRLTSQLRSGGELHQSGLSPFSTEPDLSDLQLIDMLESYSEIYQERRRAPSQRRVASRSGYDRGTVRKRWAEVTRFGDLSRSREVDETKQPKPATPPRHNRP
jgi:hypothetical protein